MSDLTLIFSSLKSRWLSSLLSIFLTAFGVMLALIIIQFSAHIQNRLSADGRNIDIVIGAKGSPLQMILSSIYHIDIPTGNIAYKDAQKWMRHPHVKTAIPLALGDNWQGFRIVGTTPDYIDHYNADLADGVLWNTTFEAVAGSATGLNMDDHFAGAHGLLSGGHAHDNEQYKITGTLKPTGTVLDRLILTSLDSVLQIHGQDGVSHEHDHDHDHDHKKENHAKHEHDHGDTHKKTAHQHKEKHSSHDHDHHKAHNEKKHSPEITAVIIKTKTPVANINLPRSINRESTLQAATPALEMARLTSMLGLGSQSFAALSGLLIIIASLSIFSGLAGSLENRMGDLAVLRAIGYSKFRIFKIITAEGLIITIFGLGLGLLMGIGGFIGMSNLLTPLQASGASFQFTSEFILLFLAVLIAGTIAAALPAARASSINVAQQLSRNA